MAAKKKKPAIRIIGWLLVFPDGKAVMPDICEMRNFWQENGVQITIRKNIDEAIEAMYGLPLMTSRYYISQMSQQPLYRELEKILQNLPEWQELKQNYITAENKWRDSKVLTEIEHYRIQVNTEYKYKRLKKQIKGRQRALK